MYGSCLIQFADDDIQQAQLALVYRQAGYGSSHVFRGRDTHQKLGRLCFGFSWTDWGELALVLRRGASPLAVSPIRSSWKHPDFHVLLCCNIVSCQCLIPIRKAMTTLGIRFSPSQD